MSDGQPYLRPAGLMWGRDADEAVEAGIAGRIAGGPVAYSMVEMSFRHEALVSRTWRTYRDLSHSADAVIGNRLALIASARREVCGLDMTRPVLMGIVNVTPDSFSDGGETSDAETAVAHGKALAAAGAGILDVGGESTRPGSEPVSAEEELRRVLPVITALADSGHVVSVDTRKAEVMRAARAAGARMINDVSALTFDENALKCARESGGNVVLMHAQGDPRTMQKNPSYDDVALDVFDALEAWLVRCTDAGIDRSLLAADPGIGFGKTFQHNLELIQRLSLFHGLGVPLVFGASRKAFIGALTGEKVAGNRASGSAGAALSAVMQGAQIIRVHDVRQTREALQVWSAGSDPFGARF